MFRSENILVIKVAYNFLQNPKLFCLLSPTC